METIRLKLTVTDLTVDWVSVTRVVGRNGRNDFRDKLNIKWRSEYRDNVNQKLHLGACRRDNKELRFAPYLVTR